MRLVVRTGVDLLHTPRFVRVAERHGNRLFDRLFTARGRAEAPDQIRACAARWAAKEAAAKMLGVGLRGLGSGSSAVSWLAIEVVHDELRKPVLVLHDDARLRAAALGIETIDMSVSHDGEYVVVSVVGAGVITATTES